ncbi:protein MKS1-like [Andrographis paniculata]|uniref:protein MKS1-like n=1 Tax=Andrographis paniculata TaxID=175694 RepID=UPI0021E740BC|nr:protein MKS1-like [Andrographis paniculata]
MNHWTSRTHSLSLYLPLLSLFLFSLTHSQSSAVNRSPNLRPAGYKLMNIPPELFSGGGNRPSPRKELQGPRPTALKVNKDSHKIRKPPPHPPTEPPPRPAADDRQPVIIYAVSPKVIHTTVTDFMNLVQRLTGNSADTQGQGGSAAGDLSPAARLASIEKLSPNKDREITAMDIAGGGGGGDLIGELLDDSQVEFSGRASGVLSPAPASLPPISPGFFSPAGDPFMTAYGNMFIPSPSTLFSVPMVSPSPSSSSSFDLFNPFFDF